MKKMSKKIPVIIGMSIVMSLATVSFASSTPEVIKEQPVQLPVEKMPEFHQTRGIVESVIKNKNNYQITIKNGAQMNDKIALNVFEDTILMNNGTGEAVAVTDIKEGDTIHAYHSLAMTRSIPPQSQAIAILTNIQENQSVPILLDVAEVTQKEDGSISVLSEDGMYLINILEQNSIENFKNNREMKIGDIKEGTRLFAWFEVMTMSIPGQTQAQKVVVIPPQNIIINDQPLELGKQALQIENGHVMVPLRLVADALGFKVSWDAKSNEINLDNSMVKTSLKIGEDIYYMASSQAIGLTAPIQYGVAPTIINGTTYVPVELFNLLYSNPNTVTIKDNTVVIKTK